MEVLMFFRVSWSRWISELSAELDQSRDYWSHVGDQRGSAVMSWIVMSGRDRGWEDSSWYQTIKAASMAGGELSARVMCSPCSCTASPCFQEVSRWDAVVCVTVS